MFLVLQVLLLHMKPPPSTNDNRIHELLSELLKGGYVGDYVGDHYTAYKG